MTTDEQRAADAAVRDAIESAARAYDLIPEDATLVDFVVMVEGMRYREEPDHDEFHAVLYRDGIARTTVALGLFDIGREMIHDDMRANPAD